MEFSLYLFYSGLPNNVCLIKSGLKEKNYDLKRKKLAHKIEISYAPSYKYFVGRGTTVLSRREEHINIFSVVVGLNRVCFSVKIH